MGAKYFFLLCLSFGLLEIKSCPSKEDVSPCTCTPWNRFKYRLMCRNLLNVEELNPPMRAIERHKTRVESLDIEKSTIQYIPDDLFRNTHIERLYFMDTQIMSFAESDTAFNELEDDLTAIVIRKVNYVSQLEFEQFRKLKILQELYIEDTNLGSIDLPLPHFPILQDVTMRNADISYIVDGAFSNLSNLENFRLDNNILKEIKRSMIPNPAKYLVFINLSRNKLSFLPDDFFDNMPMLGWVYLDENNFATLSEKPFLKKFQNLKALTIAGNPFRCDCRMNWLVNVRFPPEFKGKCSTPKALSGRNISTLRGQELWCFL